MVQRDALLLRIPFGTSDDPTPILKLSKAQHRRLLEAGALTHQFIPPAKLMWFGWDVRVVVELD